MISRRERPGIGYLETQMLDRRKPRDLGKLPLLAILAMGMSILSGGMGTTSHASESVGNDWLEIRSGSQSIRPAAAAGSYYPKGIPQLFEMVESMMKSGLPRGCKGVRSVLVPHAGYVYSGKVAASSFREIGSDFQCVFILAANHNSRVNFQGVSIPPFTHYAIPSANIPLSSIIDELQDHPLFVSEPRVHTQYMIEVELPFLHYLKGRPVQPGFSIVPMILGRMRTEEIKQLVQVLNRYTGPRTRFIFSVDLSHFYDDQEARRLDMHTINAIMSMDREALSRAVTDGNQVLLTMVELAKQNHWEPTYLGYRNSGSETGDRDRVVGYGSIAFHEPFELSGEQQRHLLSMARSAIDASLGATSPPPKASTAPGETAILRLPRGVFVTLEKSGRLRGCIGEIFPQKPLYEAVRSCAVKAATEDPRFPSVTPRELDHLSISISVLEFPRRMYVDNPKAFPESLQPGKDGIILVHKGKQSTFLPKVWKQIPDPVDFLSRLCLKQGAPSDCWRDKDTILYRYGAYDFSEDDHLDPSTPPENARPLSR